MANESYNKFIKFVDDNLAPHFIDRLTDAVAIQSVSGDPARRDNVISMASFVRSQLESFGVETKLADLGTQSIDGDVIPLPPAVIGRIGNDQTKKTVLIYGHFDVMPAKKEDGWTYDPFTLTEDNGRLYGRGSTDDKGPVMGWINVLEAHHALGIDLPVNIRMCFEGMEESGSEGLDKFVREEVQKGVEGWFNNVDCVCICDNYWLNTTTPALTYGHRGITYFNLTVSGPGKDLHSGLFGRMVHEPMTDLFAIMSQLVDSQGNILIPGIDDMVPRPTDDEIKMYERLNYTMEDLEHDVGASGIALSSDIAVDLMGRMREPSLSLHGIEGAFSDTGTKTVIPHQVIGKFSLRLVPPQTPEIVNNMVINYVNQKIDELKSKNTITIESTDSGMPWITDYNHWNFDAAKRATQRVYNQEPDLTREGGSIAVTLTFADALGVNVLLLPMGCGDDGAHSTDEKIDIRNFREGTKLMGAYFYELAGAFP